jgi:nitrite reductase/ring-hydroxylating ferredoxin subunit
MPYYLADLKRRISVARIDDRLYAFDDLSTSDHSPLSSGLLTGTKIMSPCDASRFDITTGKAVGGPATAALRTYEVRELNSEIQVRVGDAVSRP